MVLGINKKLVDNCLKMRYACLNKSNIYFVYYYNDEQWRSKEEINFFFGAPFLFVKEGGSTYTSGKRE